MRKTPAARVLIAFLLGGVVPASALDQPLRGYKMSLVRAASGNEKLVFVSRYYYSTVPALGGPDDPATGTPGGATIELFSGSEGSVALAVPPGAGRPGWTVGIGKARYRNPDTPAGPTPVRLVSMRSQRRIKIIARAAGLPLNVPHGMIGIRVTTGSLRQCALFEGAAIRVDDPGEFLAGETELPSFTFLPNCSDATLTGTLASCTDGTFGTTGCGGACPVGSACGTQDLNTCFCISAAQPCGDTFPVCNGECSSGEECLSGGGFPLPSCVCLPIGSTACSQFQCGGACPVSQECNYFELSTPGASGCGCGPPGPCGFGGDDCPVGFHCAGMPGGPGISFFCVPN
jgi:hypothetical protein